MSGTTQLLNLLVEHQLAKGLLRGALHIAIGRTVVRTADDTVLCNGVSWRDLAVLLKDSKFDRTLGKEVGADPDTLHPKEREKFWYAVIGLAKVDSTAARDEADKLAKKLAAHGLGVLPPGGVPSKLAELTPTPVPTEEPDEEPTPKKPTSKKK
jgi:hypothetical protein